MKEWSNYCSLKLKYMEMKCNDELKQQLYKIYCSKLNEFDGTESLNA